MFEEDYLSDKLQNFSLVDLALVKSVYFLVGLLIATNYLAIRNLSSIFYLILFLISAFPIVIHLFNIEGSLLDKARYYIKTNKPAYQVLLFFTMFFLACAISNILPALSAIPWYIYLILIILLAIKPARSNLFW